MKCHLAHPAGLPALPGSAHLKVTLLAQVAVPVVLAGLPAAMATVLSRCSSSVNKSRKDSDEGQDCTAVALSMHRHRVMLSYCVRAGWEKFLSKEK